MEKKSILLFILLSAFLSGAFCAEKDQVQGLTSKFHSIVEQYWKFQGVSHPLEDQICSEEHAEAFDRYQELVEDFVKSVAIDSYGESTGIDLFRELYSELPDLSRPAMNAVGKRLNEKILLANIHGARIRMIEFADQKTEYIYRLGRELERELLSADWVIERRTYFKNVKITLVVDSELVKPLKLLYPAIFLINLGSWLINGEVLFCFKTTFTTQHKLFFRTVKRIARNKVWFEVLRAKKTWFTEPKWEPYGKTYQIIEEPTGEELAREMKVLE